MATKILVLGESGTGKTTSLRNFKSDEVCYINPAKKPLPFRGKFEMLTGTVDFKEISKFIKKSNKKIIIIDDAQYIMAFPYMHRLREQGWDKYNEIQSDYFMLIDLADNLPDDVIVYFLSHIQVNEDGRQKIKTIGKMLDEKITIEGMFTTVLKTLVSNGNFYFTTQNSGNDTVKSPIDMFPTFAIDNDLKYVDEKVRNYYEIGDFKSDEEMQKEDEKVKNDEIEKGSNGRVKKAKAKKEDSKEEPRKSRAKKDDSKIEVEEGEPIPFDQAEEEKPAKRTRRKKD